MRRRKILAGFAVLVILATSLFFLFRPSDPFAANISITPKKYERSRWHDQIDVRVAITNTGAFVLIPEDSNVFDPDAFLRVELPTGWTNAPSPASYRYSHTTRLRPGQGMTVRLSLPGGTRRWQIGYFVQTATPQESAAYLTADWGERLSALGQKVASDKQGFSRTVWSDTFEVPQKIEFNPSAF